MEVKMESKTINTKFEKSALPRWAQRDQNVVELCKNSLSFRCDVFAAKTAAMKRFLKQEAARMMGEK
jgi:hypothetical protein